MFVQVCHHVLCEGIVWHAGQCFDPCLPAFENHGALLEGFYLFAAAVVEQYSQFSVLVNGRSPTTDMALFARFARDGAETGRLSLLPSVDSLLQGGDLVLRIGLNFREFVFKLASELLLPELRIGLNIQEFIFKLASEPLLHGTKERLAVGGKCNKRFVAVGGGGGGGGVGGCHPRCLTQIGRAHV